ncbi:helix-turn-helix transcriptional regulator [Clostridium thermarum]|uniref:helix-turn-helix transcriptional regulator n=1 Tax=Clostridium thermarum TaxID=1716543 RepID=UPI001FADC54E|nr:AraC family transcriptional regulator [Clostridium thermarum]
MCDSSKINYINNLEEDITADDLAEKLYLSKFHLSREFKKHTFTTIHMYIVQKKLIDAKELILIKRSVTDVYRRCGFGDYSNFFRAFKNIYFLRLAFFAKLERSMYHQLAYIFGNILKVIQMF